MNITPEQIRALNAGAEADRLAAEFIMGWKWYWWQGAGERRYRALCHPSRPPAPNRSHRWSMEEDGDIPIDTLSKMPAFSSYWEAMEQLVIQMRQRDWEWGMYSTKSGFMAGFSKTITLDGNAKFIKERAEESGAPLAVVKAALLALVAEKEATNDIRI